MWRDIAFGLAASVALVGCANAQTSEYRDPFGVGAGKADAPLPESSVWDDTVFLSLSNPTPVRAMHVIGGNERGYSFQYVRAGATLQVKFGTEQMWERLHPGTRSPDASGLNRDRAAQAAAADRMKQLGANLTVIFLRDGAEIGTVEVGPERYDWYDYYFGANPVVMTTAAFDVPAQADQMRFSVELTDAQAPGETVTVGPADVATFEVYAGHDDHRHAVFLNTLEHGRVNSVVEEDYLPAGGTIDLLYDYDRADAVIDRSRRDLRIGRARPYPGGDPVDVFGRVEYDISAVYLIDGGEAVGIELPRTQDAAVFGSWYAGEITTPADSAEVAIAFHVEAYLVADYSVTHFGSIYERWYGDGQRIPLADRWDNLNDQPGDNYILELETDLSAAR